MKRSLTAFAAAMVLALPAHAVDEHHPEGQSAAPAQAPAKTVQQMQDNAKKMESQLDRLAKAKTPEERQKLLAEHMQTMRENMMLGQQMGMGDAGCPMMGMMGRGGMMMGSGGAGMDPEAMMNRMQHMEKRMDMMQMMMERQMGSPQAPKP